MSKTPQAIFAEFVREYGELAEYEQRWLRQAMSVILELEVDQHLREIYFALKSKLPPGAPQGTLNFVIDEHRMRHGMTDRGAE